MKPKLLSITCKKYPLVTSITCTRTFVVELFERFCTSELLLFMFGNANNEVMQFGRISLQCELKLQDLLSVQIYLYMLQYGSYSHTKFGSLQVATKNE